MKRKPDQHRDAENRAGTDDRHFPLRLCPRRGGVQNDARCQDFRLRRYRARRLPRSLQQRYDSVLGAQGKSRRAERKRQDHILTPAISDE